MKINITNSYFIISIILVFVLTSFNKNIKSEIIVQNDWSFIQTTSCLKLMQYQFKKDKYPGKWYIRFINKYKQSVSMDVKVKGNIGTKVDYGRFTVKAGDTFTQYYYVDSNSDKLNFSINKIKFDDTSWGEPYSGCDND
ncbi:hypothetical protein NO995_00735 [Aestuariibaculum sp. M13]|uniref:hypothetical protein n=1 Tax=Aestuariibaculum sp. M13 TaxID=2967132 RepID=UPI002159D50E|nr:hypothetical protein [Aestuariibaculum sp. M13]MCR8666196.1 hypothetical protein [Aestuariibaculum sp. M13]